MVTYILDIRYEARRLLAGVVYLHRISDRRVGGVAKRNFSMFRKLCGESTLKNAVIVTTMWTPNPGAAAQAEEEEREKFVSKLYAQETYSDLYKEACVELFEVLCGELNSKKNGMLAKGLTELNAMAVIMFQDTELQPLVRGDHVVMMVDCGDGSGTFCLLELLALDKVF